MERRTGEGHGQCRNGRAALLRQKQHGPLSGQNTGRVRKRSRHRPPARRSRRRGGPRPPGASGRAPRRKEPRQPAFPGGALLPDRRGQAGRTPRRPGGRGTSPAHRLPPQGILERTADHGHAPPAQGRSDGAPAGDRGRLAREARPPGSGQKKDGRVSRRPVVHFTLRIRSARARMVLA